MASVIRLALPFLLVAGWMVPARAENREIQTTILCYHVVHSPSDSQYTISRAAFRQQMEYLRDAGYSVIPLEQLHAFLSGRLETLPDNAVVITVDDGWRCTYTEIFPLMQKFGFPFTIFLYPKFVIGGDYALEWPLIREMAKQGVDVQSHALSHALLPFAYQRHRSRPAYQQWLREELVRSREILEREVGTSVRFLAYPYGAYDDTVVAAAAAAGYDAAVATVYGNRHRDDELYRLRRVSISGSTTFDQFRKYLGAQPLSVVDLVPRPGLRLDPNDPVVSARIVDPSRIDPDSVRITVIGLGSVPFSYDPRNGNLSLVIRDPLQGPQQVVVWATDRLTGQRMEQAWAFRATSPPTVAHGGNVVRTRPGAESH